jgi:hypothetical protein
MSCEHPCGCAHSTNLHIRPAAHPTNGWASGGKAASETGGGSVKPGRQPNSPASVSEGRQCTGCLARCHFAQSPARSWSSRNIPHCAHRVRPLLYSHVEWRHEGFQAEIYGPALLRLPEVDLIIQARRDSVGNGPGGIHCGKMELSCWQLRCRSVCFQSARFPATIKRIHQLTARPPSRLVMSNADSRSPLTRCTARSRFRRSFRLGRRGWSTRL